MKNDASSVLFRRLPYMLSPQLDIYEKIGPYLEDYMTVLEIGFGTGIGILQYADEVAQVDAIEIDPAAVRFAERCFPIDNVNWIEDDIIDAPWLGSKYIYDLIVMIEVLEHIPECRRALKQIPKLLRPEGQALITVPNQFRHRQKEEVLNIQEWTPETFNLLLLDYFTDVKLVEEDLQSELFHRNTTATPIIAICS